uniref:Uncharacterized protein n=1 Tax=Tetraselmis sp. GSL018 TaxID=582737 RepID=A0A061SHX6_9CHLO
MILRGHFVDSDTSTCFGLHGTALAEIQECTRDEDKKLLKLIVTDYRGREVCTAVEKSGGDATKLKTPETDANWRNGLKRCLTRSWRSILSAAKSRAARRRSGTSSGTSRHSPARTPWSLRGAWS